MNKLLSFAKRYPLSLLCIALIWYLSVWFVPFESPLNDVKFIDKWTHFVMYGGFSFAVCYEHKRISWHTILLPILMGGMIELAQAYLTTCRSGEWLDLLANSIGVVIGNTLYFLVKGLKSKVQSQRI
jgi:VanZ family protein